MFDAKMDAPMNPQAPQSKMPKYETIASLSPPVSVAVLVAAANPGVRFMVDYYLFLLVLTSDGSGIFLEIILGLKIYTQSYCDMLVRVSASSAGSSGDWANPARKDAGCP
jgi:hypothetical protein